MTLRGVPVLIFGGGRGLGRTVALAVAREGARVAVAARTPADVDAVAQEARAAGAEASLALVADARRERDVEEAFNALGAWGPPAVVINTVGESLVKPFLECTLEDWHRVIDGNLTPAFLISKAALPRMSAGGGGRLVHVSSRVAIAGAEVAAAYGAAKGGVVALGRSLALVGRSAGVTVDVISPAPMDTPMRWAATPDFDRARTLPPEAIADLIVALAKHPAMRLEDGAVPLALRY